MNNSTINAKLIFDENENKGNFVAKKNNSLSGTIFEIDSVFQQAQQYKYKIMDFRGTPGGVIKNAYRIAYYLILDTVEGGIFITRKYSEKALDRLNKDLKIK
ncbi:hypothetical protein AGMMS50262_02130 [Bacteroidia bacterium]|nr:hypothetical protein AGMMS50262_02130 [Bacteroidia bacterium]